MTVRIITGDCRQVLRTLPDESVHCVVTSPPYWGLRDYGVAGQIGLESSHQAFVDEIVSVFREARRVLRRDGTLWLNIGDSYATRPYGDRHTFDPKYNGRQRASGYPNRSGTHAFKHKDMCGIPWRVALALQADGWWLRQDIIWHKPNPMPESVTDRCTKSHEYIFLLTRSDRYFFDAAAIAEPASENTHQRIASKASPSAMPGASPHRGLHKNTRAPGVTPKSAPEGSMVRAKESWRASTTEVVATRNKRSVWSVQTAPFPEAHFATFPPALIEPCILAGCPQGGVVLDPFGGAGTTGLVADRLQRSAILIELNPAYCAMAARRLQADAPLFQTPEAAE